MLKYLVNLTMVQYYFNIDNIDSPYWTLVIEILFYSFIIFLMLTNTIKYIEFIGGIVMLCCLSYTFDVVATNIYLQNILIALPIISYFPLFYAGIILYKMKFEQLTLMRMSLFMTTLIIQCFLFRHCYRNISFISITEYVVTLSLIYGVFILFLFNKLKVIVNPLTKWLGQLSYSLYLIHQYIGLSIIIPGLMKYLHLNFWISVTITFVVILLLAHLIHHFVEKPALQFLRRNKNSVNN
jgi:peptidoglycan/LPS O-acetylase OafA/YrhL